MGQGSDSCGGWEVLYDPLTDVPDGYWEMASGEQIKIADMTVRHLRNVIRLCKSKAECANFTGDADRWSEWADVFERELHGRSTIVRATAPGVPPEPKRGTTATMRCHCGRHYEAREADLKRGWGKSCSKHCAAVRREFGRPAAKRVKTPKSQAMEAV
ncbi:hypothetical protein WM40_25020 [Robbsia andropogonis]|uniref:Uncharacterized protein n=1 Tax=Robbsia andropogonis TaxID=28092 RepID=A0A0F5JTJ6_9BURK|nr:hypothetical protein WM40_25020 [Robbsia andropogonis]